MAEQTKIMLANGTEIPQFGLGVYQIPDGEETENAVKTALNLGYRHIDTAHMYGNEKSVGKVVAESLIPRDEIWITSKIWPNEYADPDTIDKMLERFGLEYVDLVLLHQQVGDFHAAWRTLEKALADGKVRAIGISNFDGERLTDIYSFAKTKPMVAQVELHPYYQQRELREFLDKYDTKIESWYPLGHGDPELLSEEIFAKLSEKYGKTPAQIILRWHIQMENIVFPRSTSEEHLRENLDVFDFELTEEEMNGIAGLDRGKRYFTFNYEQQVERFANWAA